MLRQPRGFFLFGIILPKLTNGYINQTPLWFELYFDEINAVLVAYSCSWGLGVVGREVVSWPLASDRRVRIRHCTVQYLSSSSHTRNRDLRKFWAKNGEEFSTPQLPT